MFGVTRIPPRYRRALSAFDTAFWDERNRTSFRSLVSALILAESRCSLAHLSRGISHPDAKSREAYEHFLLNATWSSQALAQHLLDYTLSQHDTPDHLFVHIDDTFVPKDSRGNATDGVAELHNPATGDEEWGNKLVTSCLEVGDIFVPYRIRMYIPEHLSSDFQQPFKTKLEIALEDILQPLQLPAGVACTVVADNAYMAANEVSEICRLGYDCVSRIQTDRRIQPPHRFGKRSISAFAETLEFRKVTVPVRGEDNTYLAADSPIFIPELGGVRLVATKSADDQDDEEDEPEDDLRFYISTNLDLSAVEILRRAEHRWNLETVHQEADEKFGFKEYELETKKAIERFLQLICVAWTVTVVASDVDEPLWTDQGRLAVRLDRAKDAYLRETSMRVSEMVDSSLPVEERRNRMDEAVRKFSWDGLSVPLFSTHILLFYLYYFMNQTRLGLPAAVRGATATCGLISARFGQASSDSSYSDQLCQSK